MSNVGDLRKVLFVERADFCAFPFYGSLGWREETAQNAQETGLATAVRSGQL
jgi:hypothetical protein